MTDPFERLRETDATSFEPDIAALKARARRIQRRRQTVLVAGPLAIAIIAGAGIFLRAGLDGGSRDLTSAPAQDEKSRSLSLDAEDAATPGAERSAAEPISGDAEAGGAAQSNATMSAAESKEQGLEATLEVKPVSVGRGADLTLKVCNPSDLTVERSFPNAQRYDFIVSNDDEVVWQWSEGQAFASVQGTETWGPKECKEWTENWDGMTSSGEVAPPGEYNAIGMLATDPQVLSERETFCLEIC